MAEFAVENKLGAQLGSIQAPVSGKQWHITNEHGVKSVISDEHMCRMQMEAKLSKHYADKLKSYTIVEVTGEGELADAKSEEDDAPVAKNGKGKKADAKSE